MKLCWGRNPNLQKSRVGRIEKSLIKNSLCHPELAAPLVSDEKEAYKGGGSQSISGSYHRQKFSTISTQKSNVGLKAQPTLISVSPRRRSIVMQGLRPNSPRKVAFTLAEVLITLGIIGVVAAMTLPTLINNIEDRHFKSAFKKQYSVISQAMQIAYIEEGITNSEIDWLQMPKYFCRLQKSLKVLRSGTICPEDIDSMHYESDENGGLDRNWPSTGFSYWHKSYKWFDKQGIPYFFNTGYESLSMILTDGTILQYGCSNQIFIDVNSYNGPNTIGRDIFYLLVNNNKTIPDFFYPKERQMSVNACSGSAYATLIKEDNYEEDCKNGTGWGCSPLAVLK